MNPTESVQLLYLWIAFAVLAVIGISAILVWAVRSGQFSEQERARGLPLVSGVPDTAPTERRPPSIGISTTKNTKSRQAPLHVRALRVLRGGKPRGVHHDAP